jgi:sugar O-acyltransferase (sialic acid O-acetyltransferase NeuD family)
VGAGGGFFDICEELENNDFELIGYINDVEVHDLEYPYLGGDDTVLRDDVVKIVTVAGVGKGIALREKLHEMHKNVIVNLIFNDAIVSRYATYKKNNGIIIYPQTYVKAKCHIGEGVLINSGCIIGHHTKIGDFTQLSLGVNVGGTTSIGKRCFVGMGAQIFNHVTIGDNCIIYAGSIVKKSLPDNSIVRVNNKILDETIV